MRVIYCMGNRFTGETDLIFILSAWKRFYTSDFPDSCENSIHQQKILYINTKFPRLQLQKVLYISRKYPRFQRNFNFYQYFHLYLYQFLICILLSLRGTFAIYSMTKSSMSFQLMAFEVYSFKNTKTHASLSWYTQFGLKKKNA